MLATNNWWAFAAELECDCHTVSYACKFSTLILWSIVIRILSILYLNTDIFPTNVRRKEWLIGVACVLCVLMSWLCPKYSSYLTPKSQVTFCACLSVRHTCILCQNGCIYHQPFTLPYHSNLSSFLTPNIVARGNPRRSIKYKWGMKKFSSVSSYILETIQHKDIVTWNTDRKSNAVIDNGLLVERRTWLSLPPSVGR